MLSVVKIRLLRKISGRTDQPGGPQEQSAPTGDDAIRDAEVGSALVGAIEDQQLMFDEEKLSHYGTDAAPTRQSGEVVMRWMKRIKRSRIAAWSQETENSRNCGKLAIRPSTRLRWRRRSQSREPQESASIRRLLENGETSGIPRLNDDVILAVEFAKYGVMDMLKVFESEIVLGKNR